MRHPQAATVHITTTRPFRKPACYCETRAYRRLKMQALVGRVLSLAVAVISIVAAGAKVTLWPVAVLVALIPLSLLAGWAMYREHPDGREQQVGH